MQAHGRNYTLVYVNNTLVGGSVLTTHLWGLLLLAVCNEDG